MSCHNVIGSVQNIIRPTQSWTTTCSIPVFFLWPLTLAVCSGNSSWSHLKVIAHVAFIMKLLRLCGGWESRIHPGLLTHSVTKHYKTPLSHLVPSPLGCPLPQTVCWPQTQSSTLNIPSIQSDPASKEKHLDQLEHNVPLKANLLFNEDYCKALFVFIVNLLLLWFNNQAFISEKGYESQFPAL